MALTLVKETGSGADEAANTYLTREEADAYQEAVVEREIWAAATGEEKDRALVQAARILDTQFIWEGRPVKSSQPLAWPRRCVVIDGEELAGDAVPRNVRWAQAEIARELLTAGGFQVRPPASGGCDAMKKLSLGKGALEIEYQDQASEAAAGNENKTAVTPYVQELLRDLGTFKQSSCRVVKVYRG